MNNNLIQLLVDNAIESIPQGAYEIPDEFCEKFAELIVQECLELVAGFYYYDDRTCHYARPRIRQHFGIEQ